MLGIKGSFLRAKYSLTVLKNNNNARIERTATKRGFSLMWSENTSRKGLFVARRAAPLWAPAVGFIINAEVSLHMSLSGSAYDAGRSSCVLRVNISSENCCLINFQNAASKKYYRISGTKFYKIKLFITILLHSLNIIINIILKPKPWTELSCIITLVFSEVVS